MPIEEHPDGGFVATGLGIELYRLVAIRAALKHSSLYPARVTRPAMARAKQLGYTGRTYKGAADFMTSYINQFKKDNPIV